MVSIHEKYEVQNLLQEVSEHDPFTLECYQQFSKFLPPKARTVLDVGCNTGRGGAYLKAIRLALEIFGLDCSPKRLDALPEAYSRGIYGLSSAQINTKSLHQPEV